MASSIATSRRHRSRLRRMAVAITCAAAAGLLTAPVAGAASAGTTGAAPTAAAPGIVVSGGMTQPAFAPAEAITERVWVETTIDTDSDGRLDRVAVDIERPAPTADGMRVASILTASPYWECCQDVAFHPVDLDRLPQEWVGSSGQGAQGGSAAAALVAQRARLASATAAAVRSRYLPRGYATVSAQTIGTSDSEGCPTSGDRNEMLSAKAVVDWLAGRGTAFDEAGAPVRATWSTGKVGMIGASYDGTLPQMVATTGVRGLETIVPISAISSWYDYYRANGLVVAPGGYQGEDTDILAEFVISDEQKAACAPVIDRLELAQDRRTGDWSPFWQERDYVAAANRVRASVFAVHGLNDWNVKTKHVEQFWNVLAANGVPRKIWWHQGEHGPPPGDDTYPLPGGGTRTFDDAVNRWMDRWLYGVDNGIEREPMAVVQREGGAYRTYPTWPDAGVRDRAYPLSSLTSNGAPPSGAVRSFVDTGRTRTAEQLAARPNAADPNRLAFVTQSLPRPTRFSGTPVADLSLSVDNRRAANVTALLVDYAPDGTASIVTRGWIDPQNRRSIRRSDPLAQGVRYGLRFGLQPDDYVFPAGHRIGIVVIATDYDFTLRPNPGTRLSVDPARSRLHLPVVGG
jgi:X-Pro dipeptidyl-peptidase